MSVLTSLSGQAKENGRKDIHYNSTTGSELDVHLTQQTLHIQPRIVLYSVRKIKRQHLIT